MPLTVDGTTKFKVTPDYANSNLKDHITWFEDLKSGQYFQRTRHEFESQQNKDHIEARAKQIVAQEVYVPQQQGSRYQRSFALLHSFRTALTGDEETAEITLYSDKDFEGGNITAWNPTGTASNIAGEQGAFSYAAFFERPEFNTFLENVIEDPIRPYVDQMSGALNRIGLPIALKAYLISISRQKPTRQYL